MGADIHGSLVLELTWTIIPFILSMVMFVWGADLFFRLSRPPVDSMDIFVVGKQWMWKVQHPTGVREINEMHVPIGRNVRVTLGSEDVIHDYSIPAFRVKMDVGPGQADDAVVQGDGAGHVSPVLRGVLRHEALGDDRRGHRDGAARTTKRGSRPAARSRRRPRADAGRAERLFNGQFACVTCHKEDGSGLRPDRSTACSAARSRWPTAARSSPTTTTCASRS